jgi:hypothetical protein
VPRGVLAKLEFAVLEFVTYVSLVYYGSEYVARRDAIRSAMLCHLVYFNVAMWANLLGPQNSGVVMEGCKNWRNCLTRYITGATSHAHVTSTDPYNITNVLLITGRFGKANFEW